MSEIPETVILAMQGKVYEYKDCLVEEQANLIKAQKEVEKYESNIIYRENQLRETLTFLQEHNPEAHEDWFASVGLEYLKQYD